MRDSDKKRFAEIMTMAHAVIGLEVTRVQLAAWFALLRDFSIEQVEQALERHLLDPEAGKFAPKPADIVRQCQGTHSHRALRAWQFAMSALQHIGPYQSVAFDDPLIHAVIASMGGWERFCAMTNDDLPFRQRDFERAYTAACIEPPGDYPRYLPGICERENRNGGYPVEQPVLIGNTEMARRVVLGGADVDKRGGTKRLAEVKQILGGPPEAA